MKTYIEIEKKQEEYNNKYDVLDKNDEKKKKIELYLVIGLIS